MNTLVLVNWYHCFMGLLIAFEYQHIDLAEVLKYAVTS